MLGFYKIFIFSLKNLRPVAVALDSATAVLLPAVILPQKLVLLSTQLFFTSIKTNVAAATTTIIKEIMVLTVCHVETYVIVT